MICINAKCERPTNPEDRMYFRYPDWDRMSKMIVEHCTCGKHNRLWTTNQAKKVFRAAGVDLRKMIRVGEQHRA